MCHVYNKGGSSGGAGALSALNIGYINMGSDMAGSIRNPAANDGVYGFKPSYSIAKCGDVDVFPYCGHNGPLSSNMDNIILYMQELQRKKKWNMDRVDLSDKNIKSGNIKGLRIAVSKDLCGNVNYVDNDIWNGVLKVANKLKILGCKVDFIEPDLKSLNPFKTFFKLAQLEYRSYSTKVDNYENGKYKPFVDPGLYKISKSGNELTADQIGTAIEQRDWIVYKMKHFMTEYDILLTPSTPIPPRNTINYLKDAHMIDQMDGKLKSLHDCQHNPVVYTVLANITGQPSISIPTGVTDDKEFNAGKLPIGVMLIGKVDRDDVVLRVANALKSTCKAILAKL